MKTRSLATAALTLCGVAIAIAGCPSAASDWNQASLENTVAAYQNFLATHPTDTHASEARAMILQIQDNNAWSEAKSAGTAAAYHAYLEKHAQGMHAAEARETITAIGRAAAWKSTQSTSSVAALQDFLTQYPTGSEVPLAQAKLKELSRYRVRLVSELSDDKAQRRLAPLTARFRDSLHDLRVISDPNGKLFSVESMGMSEQEAINACDAVKRAHHSCQVIQQ